MKGDEGSGFWIGREYGKAKRRRLSPRIREVAALAPRVLAKARRGDAVCRGIIVEAQEHLARLVEEVAVKLWRLPALVPVSWAGGLMNDSFFRRGVLERASFLLKIAGLRLKAFKSHRPPVEAYFKTRK